MEEQERRQSEDVEAHRRMFDEPEDAERRRRAVDDEESDGEDVELHRR